MTLNDLDESKANWSNEVWKDIVGYDGRYEVSNLGRIRRKSKNGTIFKSLTPTHNCKKGQVYPSVDLFVDYKRYRVSVHKIVAIAFCENPNGHKYIDHLDNNPNNSEAINLKWTTQSENIQRAYDEGRKNAKGECNGKSKLKTGQIIEMRLLASQGTSNSDIAKKFSISYSHVRDIINKRRWSHVE